MGIAKTCICGARIEGGSSRCPSCTSSTPRPESGRGAQRAAYDSREYRRNRMVRYQVVGGRCEHPGCAQPLKGPLFPMGVAWECDHVEELADVLAAWGGVVDARMLEYVNRVSNLRCFCKRHHQRKTTAMRRSRRR